MRQAPRHLDLANRCQRLGGGTGETLNFAADHPAVIKGQLKLLIAP